MAIETAQEGKTIYSVVRSFSHGLLTARTVVYLGFIYWHIVLLGNRTKESFIYNIATPSVVCGSMPLTR